jgi:AcrR family transcriptional regulator
VKERKEKEKELRKEDILKNGEQLFIKKGFANTTMDEIAKVCELAKGTLYLYFSSKEELLFTIIYRALSNLYELMFEYQKELSDPIEKLRMVGKAYFEFYSRYPDHFRLLNDIHIPGRFHPPADENRHEMIHERIKDIWLLITKIVRDGRSSGVFKESADPLEVAISLWSISTSMIKMHDFSKYLSGMDDMHSQSVFANFDYLKVININAKRIVYSIMKNPPKDFESMQD